MKHTPFALNNRFLVNPATGDLSDQQTGNDIRLEPRLLSVLCSLAANVNQLVTREQLIKEVWDNYGGADEGLNQAISFLRKALDDPAKKIIKTIPTKGYLLNAAITDVQLSEAVKPKINTTGRRKILWIAALILIVMITAAAYYYWSSGGDTLPVLSVKPMPDIKTEVKPNLSIKPIPNLPPRDTLKRRDSI
jgi:DNA-binding winged helix-turn-helix (wHTH) protein